MNELSRRDMLQMAAGTVATVCVPALTGQAEELSARPASKPPLRVGMIGLDTVHVTVFGKMLTQAEMVRPEWKGLRLVAAFPGGNPDFPLSKNRVAGFTKEVRELGVQIVDSIEALLPLVDVVMLESVDGRQHLEQARPVFAAGKPLFIDKPLAASLADVREIAALGKKHNVPWFTASSSRFSPGYPELRTNAEVGNILGCDVYSQARAAVGHPDLFWYGVHGVDLLYSLMGTGCELVTAVQTPYTEQVTGTWEKGRVGTYRAIREHTGKTGLGAAVFGTKGIARCDSYYDYPSLMSAIGTFFTTGKSPVPVDEMVEVFTWMAAAEESKRRGGAPVKLADLKG
ncbi:MAG: Gfo/Idh/MocA family oxidoreductase [Planctomycetaceae bacterium]|nr:Gfo/Idh/MocA family oxidoreductase [Planctomycetaceae bacterium]